MRRRLYIFLLYFVDYITNDMTEAEQRREIIVYDERETKFSKGKKNGEEMRRKMRRQVSKMRKKLRIKRADLIRICKVVSLAISVSPSLLLPLPHPPLLRFRM